MESRNVEYYGNYFRSHLEARWYVYFNELGIPIKYEEETYKLPNYMEYIPDFKLLGYHGSYLWAEVKGVNSMQELRAKRKDYAKIKSFHEMGHPIIVLPGFPEDINDWINTGVTTFEFVNGETGPCIPCISLKGDFKLASSYENRSPEMDLANKALCKAKALRW